MSVHPRREAGTLALIAQWEAMRQGRHILVDGSLRKLGQFRVQFFGFRVSGLGYRFSGFCVCCIPPTAVPCLTVMTAIVH